MAQERVLSVGARGGAGGSLGEKDGGTAGVCEAREGSNTAIKGTGRDFRSSPGVNIPCGHAGGMGAIPGWGTRILHAMKLGQKIKN